MKCRAATLLFALGFLSIGALFETASNAQASDKLTALQRDQLRHKLETLFNEQDLMIKNQKVDRGDVQHQLKEFDALKVFDRVPFKEDTAGLQKDIQTTADERGLKVTEFKRLPVTHSPAQAVPSSLYTDEAGFILKDEQLADTLPFRLTVQGNESAVRSWIESWAEDQMRLTEPEGKSISSAMKKLADDRWEIRAHAFRFRNIRFPQLKARDPMRLLPTWAARNPSKFAASEPFLWDLVKRIQAIAPEAQPLYRGRGEMILNSSRMSFYISRGIARPDRQQAGRKSSHD